MARVFTRRVDGVGNRIVSEHINELQRALEDDDARLETLESGGAGEAPGARVPTMLNIPLASGQTVLFTMPFTGTILSWTLLGNASGSVTIDIRKGAFGATLPGPGNSCVGTAPPALSSAQTARADPVPPSWDDDFQEGDIVVVVAGTMTGMTSVTLSLEIIRTAAPGEVVGSSDYRDMILATAGLAHYYPMDVTTGTNVPDIKGTNHGTLIPANVMLAATPLVGTDTSIYTGVTTSAYGVSFPVTSNFQFASGDRSIEFWFLNSVGSGVFRTILGHGTTSTGANRAWRINQDSTNILRASWYNTSGSATNVSSGINTANGSRHHVVMTREGSSLYLDLDGVRYGPVAAPASLQSLANVVTAGAWIDGSDFWYGNIAHLAVYGRALSAAESASHNTAGRV